MDKKNSNGEREKWLERIRKLKKKRADKWDIPKILSQDQQTGMNFESAM